MLTQNWNGSVLVGTELVFENWPTKPFAPSVGGFSHDFHRNFSIHSLDHVGKKVNGVKGGTLQQ